MAPVSSSRDPIDQQLRRWQADLLDLTRHNRLLHLGPRASGMIRLTHPDISTSFRLLSGPPREFTFYRPAEFTFAPLFDDDGAPTDAPLPPRPFQPDELVAEGDPRRIESILNRLRLRSAALLREQGVQSLFVAFGALEWSASANDDAWISPLVLAPVRLERKTARDPHVLIPIEDQPVFNPALMRKAEVELGLDFRQAAALAAEGKLAETLSAVQAATRRRANVRVRETDVVLGAFSFAKYAMYAEMASRHDELRRHPVVRLLAGADEAAVAKPTLDECEGHDSFQVLDADSSQLAAIKQVNAGASVVIQGPPGTGKSQTIANIITETLGRRKTVLFVSEKLAALHVVGKRLDAAGLKPFCLEIHGQDADRGAIVRDIFHSWQNEAGLRERPMPRELQELQLRRDQLADYAEVLHECENRLGRSAYQVAGDCLSLRNAGSLSFNFDDPDRLTTDLELRIRDAVRDLAAVAPVLLHEDSHPWRGAIAGRVSAGAMAVRLEQLANAAEELAESQAWLRTRYGLPPAANHESARQLLGLIGAVAESPDFPAAWLDPAARAAAEDVLRTARSIAEELTGRRDDLLFRYDAAVLDLDLTSCLDDLRAAASASHRLWGNDDEVARAIDKRDAIEGLASSIVDALRDAHRRGASLAAALGSPAPASLHAVRALLATAERVATIPHAAPAWLDSSRRSEILQLISHAEERARMLSSLEADLGKRFSAGIFQLPAEALNRRFATDFRSPFARFRPSYRAAMAELRRHWIGPGRMTHDAAAAGMAQASRHAGERAWFKENDPALAEAIGAHHGAGAASDWATIRAALDLVRVTLDDLGAPPSPELVALLTGTVPESFVLATAELRARLIQIGGRLGELAAEMDLRETPFADGELNDASMLQAAAWLETWLGQLRAGWRVADLLAELATPDRPSRHHLEADLRDAMRVHTLAGELRSMRPALDAALADRNWGIATDWAKHEAEVAAANRIAGFFYDLKSDLDPGRFARARDGAVAQHAALTRCFDEVSSAMLDLEEAFEPSRFNSLVEDCSPRIAPLPLVAEWARLQQDETNRIDEWTAWQQARDEATAVGIEPALHALKHSGLPPSLWEASVLRGVWLSWLDWWTGLMPGLSPNETRALNQLIADFKRLDTRQWALATERIRSIVSSRYPSPLEQRTRNGKRTPAGTLAHEAGKRQRIMALRKLFALLGTFLTQVKPCCLMSPLAVAQHLGETDLTFDVVIFDEASQILPADAIGTIARGRQLVVVGDRNQLPPTRFFTVTEQADDADEENAPPESVLDLCASRLSTHKNLRWHYRSRHEQLIAFSNRFIYDGELQTFPSPDDERQAIRLVHVGDGVYDAGRTRTNPVEAERVADLIIARRRAQPAQSLGVVTFSEAQMLAVQAALDERKRSEPMLERLLAEQGDEGFFVKNLENVQGDERDVIVFSVGYGRDSSGRFSHNFGPLNRAGGERRLNVAITRAREEVIVVASFKPNEIDLARTNSAGVRLFRAYLNVADSGFIAANAKRRSAPSDSFAAYLGDVLTEKGYDVVRRLGAGDHPVDLALRDPGSGRFVMAVQCDGVDYHEWPTVRERERLYPSALEHLGWRVYQARALRWVTDEKTELARLLEAIEATGLRPYERAAADERRLSKMHAATCLQ